MTLDPDRVARALALEVEPLPDGRHLVTGNDVGYVVDRDAPPGRVCSCPDHQRRHVECKHAIAVRLGSLDAEVRAALRQLIGESS